MVGDSVAACTFSLRFATLVTLFRGFGGCLGFLASSLLAFGFVTLARFYVAFVLVVTTLATEPTVDGTPEVILMVHCFSNFSVLLSLRLQHATTAMTTVRGMTVPPLVIDRFTVEECRYTSFWAHLIHGTSVTPPFTSTLVGLSGVFGPPRLIRIRSRAPTFTQVPPEESFQRGVVVPLKG